MPVAPERLEGWLRGFAERHGAAEAVLDADVVRLRAEDGAVAECHVPFPPLTVLEAVSGTEAEAVSGGKPDAVSGAGSGAVSEVEPSSASGDLLRALVVHAGKDRRVGVFLVRLGGHAAGIFEGGRLVSSKVGSRLVHGRSAAGGWSQHRFARRREKQAGEASRAAADVAVRVLVPQAGTLDAVVFGGDRRAIDALREDRRLSALFALESGPFLDVPDPRLAVLQETPKQFRAVRIRVVDPEA
ncbi:acVLRF1 family peptidyl-tRNA hydrolase [Sphaerisporangium flaviroseum]|uniref:AcVLRF1 family peptidyl-tRNA hydrolase n=1 Tax=Sphaerisporangium flaviroseum TaxID=509199 RepID=A0ABP7IQ11_9ACTN